MYSDDKIGDFKRSFDLEKYVSANFDVSHSGEKLYISCPFHAEHTPSCLIKGDRFYCYGCHAHGDSIDFLSRHLGIGLTDVISDSSYAEFHRSEKADSDTKPRKKIRSVSTSLVEQYHQLLLKNTSKIRYLSSRHVDITTIERANIGWGYPIGFRQFQQPRYFIPVYDESNRLVNVRCRIDPMYDNHTEPKYIGYPGVPNYLYNSSILSQHDSILIVGSEFDAAFLYYRYGIASVAPPGENIFKASWAKLFSGKDVLLWLDSDIAGKTGMLYAYDKLKPFANSVKIYNWPLNMPSGYDIGDYVNEHGISSLIGELVRYELE